MDMIVFQNICFSYQAGSPVFENFSASIRTGKKTSLTAPSGKGKTTLLHLMAGLIRPQSGHISFPPSHNRISMVFQENRLIETACIMKNIKLVNKKLSEGEILSLLTKAGIGEYCHSLPSSLSGGEQRRASIVRALAACHDILLLDEPFTGLDKENKTRMCRMIKEREEHRTIVLVTHNSEDVRMLGCEEEMRL